VIGCALNVYRRNTSSISVSCTLFLSLVCHSCTFGTLAEGGLTFRASTLLLHHHCLLNPLSHYCCHALLNMSPYCYLIHGTKYFRGGLNISYSVLKDSVQEEQIFCPGGQNWGNKFLMTGTLVNTLNFNPLNPKFFSLQTTFIPHMPLRHLISISV